MVSLQNPAYIPISENGRWLKVKDETALTEGERVIINNLLELSRALDIDHQYYRGLITPATIQQTAPPVPINQKPGWIDMKDHSRVRPHEFVTIHNLLQLSFAMDDLRKFNLAFLEVNRVSGSTSTLAKQKAAKAKSSTEGLVLLDQFEEILLEQHARFEKQGGKPLVRKSKSSGEQAKAFRGLLEQALQLERKVLPGSSTNVSATGDPVEHELETALRDVSDEEMETLFLELGKRRQNKTPQVGQTEHDGEATVTATTGDNGKGKGKAKAKASTGKRARSSLEESEDEDLDEA